MTDIASLGLEINTSQVTQATAELDKLTDGAKRVDEAVNKVKPSVDNTTTAIDQLGEATERTTQRVRTNNGQMNDTAEIMRRSAEAARVLEESNNSYLRSLQREIDTFGMAQSELARYTAAEQGLSRATQDRAAALGASIDAMQRDEQAARALAAAEDRATASADAFIKKLQEQVATQNLSNKEMLAYRASQLGVADSAAPLIAQLKESKGHMDGFSLSSVGARREMLVLAHELSQGNFQKFGGSMMVLGEQTGAAGLLFSSTGLAIAGVVATLGLFSYAMIKGALDQKHMEDALIMTGNYAGVTSDRLNDMAHAATEAGGSIGEAKKVATELASSGKFTGDQISYITEATVAWEHATGRSIEQIIKDFESLTVQGYGSGARATEVVSKAVLKLDDTYHFLTETIFEQIRALEKEGDAKAASSLAMETFARITHDRSEEIIENAGSVARAWNTVKEVLGGVVDAIGNVGKKATPGSEVNRNVLRLQYFDDGLTSSNERLGRAPDAMSASQEEARLKIVNDLTKAVEAKNKADAEANAQGERDCVQAEGSRAASRVLQDNQKLEKKGWSELDLAIRAYGEDLAKIQAANPDSALLSQDAVDEHMAALLKAHTPAAKTKGQDDRAKVLQDQLQNERNALEEEKRIYDSRDKMLTVYHQKLGLSDDDYYSGREAARADYIAAEAVTYAKETALVNASLARAKNPAEVAAAKTKYDQLVAAHKKFEDEMRDAAGSDALQPVVDQAAANGASDAAMNKYLSDLDEEARKLEASNSAHQTSKAAVERETIARLDLAIAYQQQFMADQKAGGATDEELAQGPKILKYLQDVRDARARIAAGLDQQQAAQYQDKSAEQAIRDWQRAGQSISDSLSDAFGNGGKALGKMFQAYSKGMADQLRAQKDLKAAKALADDDPQKVEAIQRAQLNGSLAQIKSYGDMATAAQGFFAEGSKGYQAMHAASVVLHGAEVALSLVKGVNAVLTQGEGDPYSAFARMAAMAAIVVGLGVALTGGSGGGGQSAADVQKAQGTGTVFGDSAAKSDSIRRSIDLLTQNSSDMLPINQGMLTALKAIESAMTGLTNLVVRSTGLTDGTNFGVQTGTAKAGGLTGSIEDEIINKTWLGNLMPGLVSNLVTSLFGKVTTTIVDAGLQYGGSLRALESGSGFDQYASVDTTKSSFFGLSKSTSNSVQVQGLSEELSQQFGLIFTNLDKSLQAASVAMGGSAADVTKVLDSLTLESTKVSLKGLTGDDLTDALNSVISKSMDEIAEAVFPEMEQFRQVGEGYAETVIRIATDYAKLDTVLASMGTTFGLTGTSSLAARERLIELAGGIDELASSQSSFNENFLTKAEQLAPVQKYVTDQLAAMGLQSLDTRDKFKEYVIGLADSGALATEAGAQQYTALLALADAFAQTHAATEDLTKTEQEIADERKDLQDQLNELTKSDAALLEMQRDAIADVNKALFDQVQAAKAVVTAKDALAQAYQTESTAAKTAIDSMKAWATTLTGLNNSLALSSQSILTPEQQYAEARRQFEETLASANSGDTTAQGQLSAAEQAFLKASQAINASDSQYAADYARVVAANEDAAKWASEQVDIQQASLDAMEAQVKQLVTINDSVLTVAEAIANLQAAMGVATGLGVQFDGSHAGGLVSTPYDGYIAELHQGEPVIDAPAAAALRRYFGGTGPSTGGGNSAALVAEIKNLREEVALLRKDNADQTSAVIEANYDANKRNADAVNAGAKSTAKASAWQKQSQKEATTT